jgi:hypothetical protein
MILYFQLRNSGNSIAKLLQFNVGRLLLSLLIPNLSLALASADNEQKPDIAEPIIGLRFCRKLYERKRTAKF